MFSGEDIVAQIPRLRRYARALVGERTAADDLVQDTLERAWSRRALWRPGGDLRAWLFGIMHNLRIDRLRQTRLATVAMDEEFPDLPAPPTQAQRLELRDVAAALAQVSEEQRQVLLLVALEDMSYEDVARTLGIPVGTVMSRLARGRERLRTLMQGGACAAPLKVIK